MLHILWCIAEKNPTQYHKGLKCCMFYGTCKDTQLLPDVRDHWAILCSLVWLFFQNVTSLIPLVIVNNQRSPQQISNTDILYFWNHTHYPIVTNHKGFEAVRWVCNVGINGELMKEINEEIKRQGILIKTRILDGKKSWKLVSKR